MAIMTKSLFVAETAGANPTYNISWTLPSLTGVKVQHDNPPTSNNQAALYLEFNTTDAARVVTVYFEPYVGTGYGNVSGYSGSWHQVKNWWRMVSGSPAAASVNTITTSDAQRVFAVANLYEQEFWRLNNGFRIHLSAATGTETTVVNGAVIFQ